MAEADAQREEIVERLKELIRSRGYKVADLERKMKRGRGYIAEALRGNKRLSVELILEVATALNADAQEVFTSWSRGHRWRSEIAESEAGDAELPASMQDASELLRALLLTLAEKGIVSVAEVEARLRKLQPRGSAA